MDTPHPPLTSDPDGMLELFAQHTHTPLAFLDPDFRFVRVNAAYARGSGHPIDFFSGKNHFDLFPSEARAIFEEVVQTKKVFQTFARPFQFPGDPTRGVTYWDWTLAPVLDASGEVRLLVYSLNDVTEKELAVRGLARAREHIQRSQKLESLGRMTGSIAHDFNNVLTALMAYASLMRQELPPDSLAVEDVNALVDAAERGRALISQLLAFAGQPGNDMGPVELRPMVERSRRLLERLLPSRVALEVQLEDELGFVFAHRTFIDQILMNLVVNAGDAIEGEGRVRVSAHSLQTEHEHTLAGGRLPPGAYVAIRVEDDGAGMDDATRTRILEPFFSTKGDEGTGLGLATVHDLVTRLGGGLDVESRAGEGTSITVFLRSTAPPEEVVQPASVHLAGLPSGRRILFVDDDRWIVHAIGRHLSRAGYHVVAETSALRALEHLIDQTRGVDLLVSDLTMPEMNGRELAIHARRLRSGLPVLHISGNPAGTVGWDDEPDEQAHFLVKPFTGPELDAKIRSILASSEPS